MDFNNNGISDWLEDMEADRATPPLEDVQESSDGELADWLSSDGETDTPESIDENTDLPDWLSGVDTQDESAQVGDEPLDDETPLEAAAPFAVDEGDLPDWLSDMGGEETPELDETIPLQNFKPEATVEDVGLPEWLIADDESDTPAVVSSETSDLVEETSGYVGQDTIPIDEYLQSEEAAPALSAEETDLPEWLSADAEEAESFPSAPESEGDLPEWLSSMDSVETPAAEDEAPALSAEGADLPVWLSDDAEETDSLPSTPESEGGDLPEWLSGMDGAEAPAAEDAAPALSAEETDSLPSLTESEGDLPEWLSGMDGAETPAAEDEAPALETEDTDLPDWLSADAEETESLPSAPESEGDLPEWLSGMDGAEAPAAEDETPALSAEDTDLPDWLADFSAEEEAQTTDLPKPQKPFDLDTGVLYGMLDDDDADGLSAPAVESDVPEQLPDIESQSPATAEIDLQPDSLSDSDKVDGDGLPDWLSGEDEMETDKISSKVTEDEDMPEWLTGFEEQEEALTEEAVQSEAVDLPPADDDLPAWLTDGAIDETESTGLSAAEDEDIPEWLAGFEGQEEALTEEAAQPETADLQPAVDGEIDGTGRESS
jgi:hypothetical protein